MSTFICILLSKHKFINTRMNSYKITTLETETWETLGNKFVQFHLETVLTNL